MLSTNNAACSDNGNGMDCFTFSKANLDFIVAGSTRYHYLYLIISINSKKLYFFPYQSQ